MIRVNNNVFEEDPSLVNVLVIVSIEELGVHTKHFSYISFSFSHFYLPGPFKAECSCKVFNCNILSNKKGVIGMLCDVAFSIKYDDFGN